MRPIHPRSVCLAAAAALALMVPLGTARADLHHDGHSKIMGKGDGKHLLHTSPQGHTSHAQVTNGKVKSVAVNHKGNSLNVKKFKTSKKLHAMAEMPGGGAFTRIEDADAVQMFASDSGDNAEANVLASAQVTLFVGFGYFNQFDNHWYIFWFPVSIVDGGDFGAVVFVGGGGPIPVVGGPVLNTNGFCQAGSTTSYNVQLQAGVTYTISLNTLQAGYDPYLWLYDPVGQLVAQDDDGGGFPNARIVYTPNVSGTFQIKCGSFNNSSGGNFNLKVQK